MELPKTYKTHWKMLSTETETQWSNIIAVRYFAWTCLKQCNLPWKHIFITISLFHFIYMFQLWHNRNIDKHIVIKYTCNYASFVFFHFIPPSTFELAFFISCVWRFFIRFEQFWCYSNHVTVCTINKIVWTAHAISSNHIDKHHHWQHISFFSAAKNV